MTRKHRVAEAIWGNAPDDVETGVPNVLLGPKASVGIVIGFLPLRRAENEDPKVPHQRFRLPIHLVQTDGSTRVQRYTVEFWPGDGLMALSLATDGEMVTGEVPLILEMDLLARYQDDPLANNLHLVPFSLSGNAEQITDDNLQDDVRVAIVQEIAFSTPSERGSFIETSRDEL